MEIFNKILTPQSKVQLKHFYTSMLKIWNICACSTHYYLLILTICKFPDMILVGKLQWRYPLINGVYRWRHECGHMNFPGHTFWCNVVVEMPTYTQVIKPKFGCNNFIDQYKFLEKVTRRSWQNNWPILL